MPKRAVVVASTSQITSGSDLPREKVEHALKLLEVSGRIPRVLFVVDRVVYRSFLFLQEALGRKSGQSQDETELNALKERVKTLSYEKTALEERLKKLS